MRGDYIGRGRDMGRKQERMVVAVAGNRIEIHGYKAIHENGIIKPVVTYN